MHVLSELQFLFLHEDTGRKWLILFFFLPRDLNRLVMDYLVIEGYKSAAEEFSLECGVQPAVDFASIESRRNIREALNRGDVQEAITRVNDLNPEVN